jgi:hypothetical protein
MGYRSLQLGGVSIAAACTAVALWLALSAPDVPRARAATPDEAERFVVRLRSDEPGLRRKALERFPADGWSQGDHFGSSERRALRDGAQRDGVDIDSLIRALDEDVRRHPLTADGAPRAPVAPCMPRPFYE